MFCYEEKSTENLTNIVTSVKSLNVEEVPHIVRMENLFKLS